MTKGELYKWFGMILILSRVLVELVEDKAFPYGLMSLKWV